MAIALIASYLYIYIYIASYDIDLYKDLNLVYHKPTIHANI